VVAINPQAERNFGCEQPQGVPPTKGFRLTLRAIHPPTLSTMYTVLPYSVLRNYLRIERGLKGKFFTPNESFFSMWKYRHNQVLFSTHKILKIISTYFDPLSTLFRRHRKRGLKKEISTHARTLFFQTRFILISL